MPERVRWGILGTGNIARQFAEGLRSARLGSIGAVGSRTEATARDFANAFQVPAGHGSYDALLRDPSVDVVYNSLPNNLHHEWTIKALRAGKHVLCEKPFAVNARQAEEMFAVARQEGRVLMEAFMYRTHPLTAEVERAIASGAIGKLKVIRTSFCYRTTKVDGNVRFAPELAGGALMDIGCYCVSFSRHFAGGEPTEVRAVGHVHPRGVDDYVAGVMRFPGDVVATFTCGMTVQSDNTAYLCGEEGYIEIPVPWKPPAEQATFTIARGAPPKMDGGRPAAGPPPRETRHVDAGGHLYGIEADAFARCVLDGTPVPVTEAETLGNMRVLDDIRRQIGLAY